MLSKERIKYEEPFIPYTVLEKVVKLTNIERKIFEEEYSEFVVETLHGKGNIFFEINNIYYEGTVKYGILDSDNAKILFEDAGIIYEGEIRKNQITGKGVYTFVNTGST
jgi:hypothetical protein